MNNENIYNRSEIENATTSPLPYTSSTKKEHLGTGLKSRHLTMMGLGSAIGAGLFLGTGVGIKAAGSSVIIAYILAGILVLLVMYMLCEMAAARPSSGSFSTYAQQAYGPVAGFALGWLYWFMLVMVMGAELTGAAAIMGTWFAVPSWIPALITVIFFASVNLANVQGFGEFEFWFAFVKVAVIVIFIIIGLLMVFGFLPGHPAVELSNFFNSAGFIPNGITGIAAGLLAVAFAFGGIELLTIAAAESDNPAKSIRTAMRSSIWRISVFYIGTVLIICLLLPYDLITAANSAAESPFTMVLTLAHIPGTVGIMELVIVLALLSAFNAQFYGTSRMLFSLSRCGNAPRLFSRTNTRGIPRNAVLYSIIFAFCSVALQYWNPPSLLEFLLNAVGGSLLVIWFMIAASYLKLHPLLERNGELTLRMWWYPWLGWLTIVGMLGLVALMLWNASSRMQVFSVAILFMILIILGLFTRWFQRSREIHAQ